MMTAGIRPPHHRVSKTALYTAAGISVAFHVAVIAVIVVLLTGDGDGLGGSGFGVVSAQAANTKAAAEIAELEDRCIANAILAASARGALCLAPFEPNGRVPDCADDVQMRMFMEMSSCRARLDNPTDIAQLAMVEPKQAEKLPQIDAEQLLDEMKQQEKQQPPPPLPQPQVQQQPPPPPPPPPPAAKVRPQQVVETVKPNTEQEPNDARFLSEHNIKVDKQKVSRGARNEPMVAKAKPEELTPKKDPSKEENSVKEQPPEMAPGKNEKAPETPGKLSMRKAGAQSPAEQAQEMKTKGAQDPDRGPLALDGYRPRRGNAEIEQLKREAGEVSKQGQNGAGGGTPPMPNLKPSKDQLERALGGGSVDHLEDVENSDETALSSKRWVHASFFNRLKRQVAQNWDPQTVWRRSDPNGTHYGFKTRVTEVRVTLGPKGELAKIVVTTPSGSNELDEEALRSFKAAAPFPNPPEELLKQGNGQMTFAFSFYFEIGQSRTSWRVIRQ
ncbi:MAG: TonB C-terminal domain-containing protein [Deltaproteobacteria bacterium]|nr:TonB C-terminal domain-containing protein [Deltaproteobacteria bacterium]